VCVCVWGGGDEGPANILGHSLNVNLVAPGLGKVGVFGCEFEGPQL